MAGLGVPREHVFFLDLNGDKKSDYAIINTTQGALSVWVNVGGGSAWHIGDGVVFADFDGDGRDDYAFISINGAIELGLNGGPDPAAANGWVWITQGLVADAETTRHNVQ